MVARRIFTASYMSIKGITAYRGIVRAPDSPTAARLATDSDPLLGQWLQNFTISDRVILNNKAFGTTHLEGIGKD